MKSYFIAVVKFSFLMLLSGCSLAPLYEQPSMPVPKDFSSQQGEAGASEALLPFITSWKEFFADPVLQELISRALVNNRDLKTAALAMEEFQARYRIERSQLLPSVHGQGGYVRQKSMTPQGYPVTEVFSASVGITVYELDFFSRIRNLKDAALEQYLAMEATHQSVGITLVAQVAEAYFRLLSDQEMVRIDREIVSTEQASYELIEQRVQAGITNELELVQARSSLENARFSLAMYERLADQAYNALQYLVGNSLADITIHQKWSSAQQLSVSIPNLLSSDVLLHRPDIIAAEHSLKASYARIGAARAAFFPSISLTGNAGFMSDSFSNLFEADSKTWVFAPTITLPIFTGGRLKGQLDASRIRKEIAVVAYEQSIERAFREVADALVARKGYDAQLEAQKALLAASNRYYELARERYDEGLDSFLTLLDAQRLLSQARRATVSLELARLLNQISLYKAIGGGSI